MSKIGINGFGRVGRTVLRAAIQRSAEVLAINDPFISIEEMVSLIKFDSTYGRFKGRVSIEGQYIWINKKFKILVMNEEDPENIKWSESGAWYIIEASGKFTTVKKASAHLSGGAKKIIITALSPDAPSLVCGVNLNEYQTKFKVVCSTSCTACCVAPLLNLLHEKFEIIEGMMTTLHAFTATQNTLDGPSEIGRRDGRGARQNIIPTATGIGKVINKLIPELKNKFQGIALRVPTPNASVIDLTLRLYKPTTSQYIKREIIKASNGELKGIVGFTDEQVVSSDFRGDTRSAIFDAEAGIMLNEHFVKLVAWYDSECSYANRVLDLIEYMQARDRRYCIHFDRYKDGIPCMKKKCLRQKTC